MKKDLVELSKISLGLVRWRDNVCSNRASTEDGHETEMMMMMMSDDDDDHYHYHPSLIIIIISIIGIKQRIVVLNKCSHIN